MPDQFQTDPEGAVFGQAKPVSGLTHRDVTPGQHISAQKGIEGRNASTIV
jgi:hypothetical protein